jgi:hypothetical protein
LNERTSCGCSVSWRVETTIPQFVRTSIWTDTGSSRTLPTDIRVVLPVPRRSTSKYGRRTRADGRSWASALGAPKDTAARMRPKIETI